MVQNFLLIDGSYFVFFRYYALLNWFKLAKKEQIIDKEHPPYENIEFSKGEQIEGAGASPVIKAISDSVNSFRSFPK